MIYLKGGKLSPSPGCAPILLLALVISIVAGCNGCYTYTQSPNPQYEVLQSPTGMQQVVVTDNSGTQFLMDYILFNQLMSSGGYNTVTNYYHVHRNSYPVYVRSNYSSWKSVGSGTYRNYSSNSYKNTTPSSSGNSYRSTTPSTYKTAPSSNSYKSSTPSYKPTNSYRSTGSSYRRR